MAAKELSPCFHEPVSIDDGVFVAGVGWSVISTVGPDSRNDSILKLIQLHWASIALHLAVDRRLVFLLSSEEHQDPNDIANLKDASERAFHIYASITTLRARVENVLASLGGDKQTLWDAISSEHNLPAQVRGVDRQIQVWREISERRAQQAAAALAQRTGDATIALTIVAAFTVIFAILETFIGPKTESAEMDLLRYGVAGVAFFACVGHYLRFSEGALCGGGERNTVSKMVQETNWRFTARYA